MRNSALAEKFRKEFTPSERVAIGEAIEGELREQAEKRMKAGGHNPKENFPEGQEGQVRDLAAKAGLGSGKTLEAAQVVIEKGREFNSHPPPRTPDDHFVDVTDMVLAGLVLLVARC